MLSSFCICKNTDTAIAITDEFTLIVGIFYHCLDTISSIAIVNLSTENTQQLSVLFNRFVEFNILCEI